ncbi:MAG: D-alanyl-D-alanine carboxypeptidase/D-alanyl-D-alanine-endopeptidase [Sphingobacteriales bacterium]|jgi:D-alanyl-D-alanine carboxypeptidase/D-alanyl-D-alanine-endopeptidase (penicillin-binding protein 4)
MKIIFFFPLLLLLLASCQTTKIQSIANRHFLKDSVLHHAHTGLAVYDPGKKKYVYTFQADKYFIPASNTKIFSCYAGMKFLGDRLQGIQYAEVDTAIFIFPTGDPTLLHYDYPDQPVAAFIRNSSKKLYIDPSAWSSPALGSGWSWDDYSEYYMPERSALPVYGNVIRWYQIRGKKENPTTPSDTTDTFIYSDPEVDMPVHFGKPEKSFRVQRDLNQNVFTIYEGSEKNAEKDVPFLTYGVSTSLKLIDDSLHKQIVKKEEPFHHPVNSSRRFVYSRPTDSMLKPMMHRSDNFFAEQTLLMAGHALTGKLNTALAIDTVSSALLTGIPDLPRWADGSGLSRFNLFTPRDFVWVLDKMKNEFPWERITSIFPTGGSGTLRSYLGEQGRLYAKTGTLSGVMALSGYVITKKNRTLIFSVLINNHRQPNAVLRAKMGAFLKDLIDHY